MATEREGRRQGVWSDLVPPPSRVPEDVDDWTPTAEAGVEIIVTLGDVVVVLGRERMTGSERERERGGAREKRGRGRREGRKGQMNEGEGVSEYCTCILDSPLTSLHH